MSGNALLRRPGAAALSELLEQLVEKETLVRTVTWESPRDEPLVIGVYADDHDRVSAVVALDMTLGRYLGAALSSVPKDFLPDGILSGTMYENLLEVLNVAAGLFQSDDCRVCLREVLRTPGAELSEEVHAVFDRASYRESLGVTVEGYGTGQMLVAIAEGMVGEAATSDELALQGSTRHISVAEILGFLAQHHKSGVLEVEQGDDCYQLVLADGCLIDLAAPDLVLGSSLIDSLRSRDDADPGLLDELSDRFLGRPVELAWEAARLELVPREAVETALRLEVHEVLRTLVGLDAGHFAFSEEDPEQHAGKVYLDVPSLLHALVDEDDGSADG